MAQVLAGHILTLNIPDCPETVFPIYELDRALGMFTVAQQPLALLRSFGILLHSILHKVLDLLIWQPCAWRCESSRSSAKGNDKNCTWGGITSGIMVGWSTFMAEAYISWRNISYLKEKYKQTEKKPREKKKQPHKTPKKQTKTPTRFWIKAVARLLIIVDWMVWKKSQMSHQHFWWY